jgi:hypothetical protein
MIKDWVYYYKKTRTYKEKVNSAKKRRFVIRRFYSDFQLLEWFLVKTI